MRRYQQRRSLGYVDPERQPWYMPILPAEVLRKVNELHRQNEAIQATFSGTNTTVIVRALGDQIVIDWALYYNEWLQFYAEMSDSYLARWTSGNVELLQDFITRSNRFEERLQSVSIATNTPTREEVERARQDAQRQDGLPTWAWALIVLGGVGVGAYALYTLSRVLREGRLIAQDAAEARGVAGLGGPRRVYDLDGPSTYNLEIDR